MFSHFLRNSAVLRARGARWCSSERPKGVQVCILGVETAAGKAAALLLKQNPLVSVLHLFGRRSSQVESMGIDLSHFDTRCKVVAYTGPDDLSRSVKNADIILMLGMDSSPPYTSVARAVVAEAPRVVQMAEVCARMAPRAVLVVCVTPISVTLPIVAEIFKETPWYHPGRLVGSTALPQVKANSLVGHYQNLDPQVVNVPIVGGPDMCCALPIFSQATPVGVGPKEADMLMSRFRDSSAIHCPLSQAYGLNRMVTGIALGLLGEENVVTGYVRTNIVKTCRHMVSTIKFGRTGVIHNFGLSKLRKAELSGLEKILLVLKEREKMAMEYVNRADKCTLPPFLVREMDEEAAAKRGILR